jgi:hypothetical protein
LNNLFCFKCKYKKNLNIGKNSRDAHFSVVSRILRMTAFKDETILKNSQEVVDALNRKFDEHYNARLLKKQIPIKSVAILFNPQFTQIGGRQLRAGQVEARTFQVENFGRVIDNMQSYFNFAAHRNDVNNKIFTSVLTSFDDQMTNQMTIKAPEAQQNVTLSTYNPNDNHYVRFSDVDLTNMMNEMNETNKVFNNVERAKRWQTDDDDDDHEDSDREEDDERRSNLSENNEPENGETLSDLNDLNKYQIQLKRQLICKSIPRPSTCYDKNICESRKQEIIRHCASCKVRNLFFTDEKNLMEFGTQFTLNEELAKHGHAKSRITRGKGRTVPQAKHELLQHYRYMHNWP